MEPLFILLSSPVQVCACECGCLHLKTNASAHIVSMVFLVVVVVVVVVVIVFPNSAFVVIGTKGLFQLDRGHKFERSSGCRRSTLSISINKNASFTKATTIKCLEDAA